MRIEDCFQLGHIAKKHGLQGEVNVVLDVDYPTDYQNLESVFVEINKQLVPFFIDHIQVAGKKAIVKFEGADDVYAAEKLKGSALHLPLSFLPELEEGQFYYHEVVGYNLVDNTAGAIGVVTNIYEFPNQDLFAVDYQGHEILVPINDAIVKNVNHEEKSIAVVLPEGLLEVYTEDNED